MIRTTSIALAFVLFAALSTTAAAQVYPDFGGSGNNSVLNYPDFGGSGNNIILNYPDFGGSGNMLMGPTTQGGIAVGNPGNTMLALNFGGIVGIFVGGGVGAPGGGLLLTTAMPNANGEVQVAVLGALGS